MGKAVLIMINSYQAIITNICQLQLKKYCDKPGFRNVLLL